MAGVRVAEILATLAAGGPSASWPGQLVEGCQVATEMSGVGLALMGPAGTGGVLAATDGHAQRMEDLQFSLGEGPCVDATRTGRPVLVPDLTRYAAGRWPAFTPSAAEGGVHAAFTFPLQVGAIAIGVLDLYRTTRGDMTGRQVTEALAYTDAAVAVLLHLQGRSHTGADHGTGTPEGAAALDPGMGRELSAVVERRAVVHQAAGMISVQLDASLAAALMRLRAHAFAADRPMRDVATDVVARRLRFDHSEAGTSVTPPHPSEGSRPAGEGSS